MEDAGINPSSHAIRGGTDGARLTFQGLPCQILVQEDIISMENMNMHLFRKWKKV